MPLFNNVKIKIEENEILRLLGFKEKLQDISTLLMIKNEIEKCNRYIEPKMTYRMLKIDYIKDNSIVLENKVELIGEYIYNKLRNCQYVIVSISTIGDKIDNIIKDSFDNGELLNGMTEDNIANTALEYFNKMFWNKMIDENKYNNIGVTKRIFPGSGLDLKEQKKIFDCLDSSLIGVSMKDSGMMLPLKTTSIIYGLGKNIGIDLDEHICNECNLKSCMYRKVHKFENEM